MTSKSPHFYFTGGCLALDFVNSKSWRLSSKPNERLTSFLTLMSFCLQTNVVDLRLGKQLTQLAEQNPAEAKKTVNRALKLRELIYQIFLSKARGMSANESDLVQFNRMLGQAQKQQQVAVEVECWTLKWLGEHDNLDRLWWPIVVGAAQVLTESESAPVRACGGEGCGWLFLDTSRNRSRRWCDMKVCGNRDKVRRYQNANKVSGR